MDGFYAAEKVREQSPENFELLARVPIRHEYIENTDTHRNHMIGIGPVLNVYPWNNEMYQIRYVSDLNWDIVFTSSVGFLKFYLISFIVTFCTIFIWCIILYTFVTNWA